MRESLQDGCANVGSESPVNNATVIRNKRTATVRCFISSQEAASRIEETVR